MKNWQQCRLKEIVIDSDADELVLVAYLKFRRFYFIYFISLVSTTVYTSILGDFRILQIRQKSQYRTS